MKGKYTFADYAFQFITITAGVLIALLINGLVEWNNNQQLVAAARATILREIADNRTDLNATMAGLPADREKMLNAIKFADELLAKRKLTVSSLDLNYNLADKISDTGWRTAERTGALSHMDYAEVQKYSRLYDFQALVMEQQRQALSQLALATSIFRSDFDLDQPNLKDVETFRVRVVDLLGIVTVQEQLAKRLAESYAEALK